MALPTTTSFQHGSAVLRKALSCWYQCIPSTQLFYKPFQRIFTRYRNCQQVCSVLAILPFVSGFPKNPFVRQSSSCALFFNVPSSDRSSNYLSLATRLVTEEAILNTPRNPTNSQTYGSFSQSSHSRDLTWDTSYSGVEVSLPSLSCPDSSCTKSRA